MQKCALIAKSYSLFPYFLYNFKVYDVIKCNYITFEGKIHTLLKEYTQKNKEEERRIKGIAMAKSFSEQHFDKSAAITFISEALHLVQPGLVAGWQGGRLTYKIQVNFEKFKIGCRLKY